MVIDCITFNGEFDILEIRLNILKNFVDEFIICEAFTTFSGNQKPSYFEHFLRGIKEGRYNVVPSLLDKIKYYIIDENYTPEEVMEAQESPNTVGASHWGREFLQKESIKKVLTHLKDDDTIFIGDCDEIWDPRGLYFINEPYKIELLVYTYYLNNRSTEKFFGTLVCNYKDIKNECLNHLRSNSLHETTGASGWHFTSMSNQLERKLMDSYTEESYAAKAIIDNLERNISDNKDFLGRDFKFEINESDWPQYLKDNRQRYKHLLK